MGWTVYNSDGQILQGSSTLADDAVTTAKILDANVTLAKVASQAANTVLVRDANSSGVVSAKAVTNTQILIGDGTGFTAAALSGDVTMANDGAVTIAATAVENSMLANDAVGADELASNAVVNDSIASSAAINFSKMENLTASRLLVSDGSGDVSVSSVTTTNLTDLTDSGATTLHSHAGGGPTEAAQSDMEDSGAGNANRYVSPEVFKYHRGSAKAWGKLLGSDASEMAEYNMDDGTYNGTGDYTLNWTTDFSSISYSVVAMSDTVRLTTPQFAAPSAGATRVGTNDLLASGFPLRNSSATQVVAFGDQ